MTAFADILYIKNNIDTCDQVRITLNKDTFFITAEWETKNGSRKSFRRVYLSKVCTRYKHNIIDAFIEEVNIEIQRQKKG